MTPSNLVSQRPVRNFLQLKNISGRTQSGNREDIRRIAQEIAAYNVTMYQADAWNDLGWRGSAKDNLYKFNSSLNGYFGSSINKPNYTTLLNLSRIIRQVTPW